MSASLASWPASFAKPNEDFAAATSSAAVLLDGAGSGSLQTGCHHGVAWFAHLLGHQIFGRINQFDSSLSSILGTAIEATAAAHSPTCDLRNPATPSATVLMLRQNGDHVEYLVLADSVLLLANADGTIRAITDDREGQTGAQYRTAMDSTPNGSPEHELALSTYLKDLLAHRNIPGGFWVAAAEPRAAQEAISGSVPVQALTAAALLSDGASRLADRFNLATWRDLIDVLLSSGPQELIRQVREAESSDPHGAKWPRGKACDDATAVLMQFD